MEWLDGVSVREVERIDALGLDRSRLAEALLRCALRQMLVDGRFHADPHPGNVLVLADGRLGLIDFGATGRLDPLQQASMREMLVAVQQRDAGLLRSAVLEVATLRRHFDDDQLERALARFMARHLQAGAAPSAAMFNVSSVCSSPSGSTCRRSSRPSSAPSSPWEDVRTVTRLLNRVVLAGPGGLVGLLSVMLLGTQGGPHFTGDTSLFQFFGYFGLFCATVLILRVTAAILRDELN
jgi:hypothetical protein